jgi:hypothetical protein
VEELPTPDAIDPLYKRLLKEYDLCGSLRLIKSNSGGDTTGVLGLGISETPYFLGDVSVRTQRLQLPPSHAGCLQKREVKR